MNKEQFNAFLEEHGADILTGVSSALVLATAFLSGRAGIKIHEVLSDGKERTLKEKIKDTWKFYILPGVAGVGSIAAMWTARGISASQITALAGFAGYAMANKKELEKRLPKAQVIEAESKTININSVEETGFGDQLCLDGFTGRWFRSSKEKVEAAVERFNKDWRDSLEKHEFAYMCMNDLYDYLGIQTTHMGWLFGWSSEMTSGFTLLGSSMIDLDNGLGEVLVIEPISGMEPYECWMEY